jgi:mono/diheme cytochrome c family protein
MVASGEAKRGRRWRALWKRRALSIALLVQPVMALSAAAAAPTFTRDIAPILRQHCIQCHRPGGIASMAQFTSYAAVRPWARAMKEAVTLRQMPPWSADPEHSLKFRNDPRLTSADIATIRSWVDAGAPQGENSASSDLTAAASDWHGPDGRPPDLVISMAREAHIPATGDLPYVRFLAKVPLAADKWIAACQARPGNASVVHHMAITEVETPPGMPLADLDGLEAFYRQMGLPKSVLQPVVGPRSEAGLFDMLAIYTPGMALEQYGDDSAKLLKGGQNRYLDFNIHYSANGKPATDRSAVAFWFRDTPPAHQIYRLSMSGGAMLANGVALLADAKGPKAEGTQVVIPAIPPGATNYELIGITAFTQPVTLFQLHPHAHFRAKDFRYVAVYPDGREQTLLSVPKYDFRWQLAYELATPLKLPAGSKLVITAHYDNSTDKEVFFRPQNLSTDEMFSPFVEYAVDTENPADPSAARAQEQAASLVETKGCLVPRTGQNWLLTQAASPEQIASPLFSSADLAKAAPIKPGIDTIALVGTDVFQPGKYAGKVVLIRGVMSVGSGRSLNVTSLLATPELCSQGLLGFRLTHVLNAVFKQQ